jgi:uncharacterized Zn-binding protein involved in type VI secretion
MTNSNADKEVFLFATIGSLTSRGGRITTATGGSSVNGLDIARVGDVVTYPDGGEAVIGWRGLRTGHRQSTRRTRWQQL